MEKRTNQKLLVENGLTDMCELLVELTGGTVREHGEALSTYLPNTGGITWYRRSHIKRVSAMEATELEGALAGDKAPLVSYGVETNGQDLAQILERAGYNYFLTQTGMVRPLESDFEVEKDPNIVRIGTERLEEWTRVCLDCFGKPEESAFAVMAVQRECYFYAYLKEGSIAGTTLLYSKDGNAGIHEVGVLPEHRGTGIAKKLVRRALADARREGMEWASLQASEMGVPLYRSLGFDSVGEIKTWMKKI